MNQESMFGMVNGAVVTASEAKKYQDEKEAQWDEFIKDKPEYYSKNEFEELRKSTIKFIKSMMERCGNRLKKNDPSFIYPKGLTMPRSEKDALNQLQEARGNDNNLYCNLIILHGNKSLHYLTPHGTYKNSSDRMIKILREIKEFFPNYYLDMNNINNFEILLVSRLKRLK